MIEFQNGLQKQFLNKACASAFAGKVSFALKSKFMFSIILNYVVINNYLMHY